MGKYIFIHIVRDINIVKVKSILDRMPPEEKMLTYYKKKLEKQEMDSDEEDEDKEMDADKKHDDVMAKFKTQAYVQLQVPVQRNQEVIDPLELTLQLQALFQQQLQAGQQVHVLLPVILQPAAH